MSDHDNGSEPSGGTVLKPQTGKVVTLMTHDPAHADRILREMRDYWSGLRNGRAVPARADVNPRGIARSLDYAFILERIAPGAARIRLAGSHLIDLMGMEVRGMPICSFLVGPSRGRLSDVLETVFKAPQIAHLHLHAKGGYARPPLTAQMLLLPLRSDLGDVTRALGCLIADGELGVAPRRFELLGDEMFPVVEGGKTLEPSPAIIGFSEEHDSFARTPPKAATTGSAAPTPAAGADALLADTPEGRRALFRVVTPVPAPDQG